MEPDEGRGDAGTPAHLSHQVTQATWSFSQASVCLNRETYLVMREAQLVKQRGHWFLVSGFEFQGLDLRVRHNLKH